MASRVCNGCLSPIPVNQYCVVCEKPPKPPTLEAKRHWETGAVRDDNSKKIRPDLIPVDPIRRLAARFAGGIPNYGERNWEKGIKLMAYIESAERHFLALKANDIDEDHAAAVLWNIVCFMETQRRINAGYLPQELDDYTETTDAGRNQEIIGRPFKEAA